MARAFTKDILRTMRSSMGRFVAILVIVALGVGFYAGLRMTAPYLQQAADSYYDQTALSDFWVTDSLGLDDEAISQLRNVDGVSGVMPEYQADALADVGTSQYSVRVHGIDMEQVRAASDADGTQQDSDDENYLNRPVLVSGTWPENAGECVISAKAADEGVQIGDTIKLSKTADGNKLSDTFQTTTFKVTGFVRSSYYVSENTLGSTMLGDGSLDDFILVDESAFDDDLPYSGAYVSATGARDLLSGSNAYDELIAQEDATLQGAGAQIAAGRTDRVKGDAQEELDEAKAKYRSSKKQAADKFAEAEEKLASAKDKLDSAKRQLANGQQKLDKNAEKLAKNKKKLAKARASYRKSLAKYRKQRSSAMKKLDRAQAKLDKKSAQVKKAKKQLATLKSQLAKLNAALGRTSLSQLQSQKSQLSAGIDELDAAIAQMQAAVDAGAADEDLKGQLSTQKKKRAELAKKMKQVEKAITSYKEADKQRTRLESAIRQMTPQVSKAQSQIKTAQSTLTAQRNKAIRKFDSAKKKLESASTTLKQSEAKLAKGESALSAARKKLAKSRASYQSGMKSYRKSLAAYHAQKQKAEKRLAKAKKHLDKAQEKIDDIETADWYVLDRTKIAGVECFANDIDSVDRIAQVFPLIFFLVAALVALTTITRMVEEDRVLIGTYKALGYSNGAIMSKYVWYALLASGIGSVLGIAVLANFLPAFILSAYSVEYEVPATPVSLDPGIVALSAGLGIGITLLAAVASVATSLREKPAALMLPRAPKAGKRILLERIKPLWSRLGFSWKVTWRNIFRYKQRFFMAIIGVAGCTALMLTGFGLHDSINDLVDKQYGEGGVQSYNLKVQLEDTVSAGQRQQVESLLEDDSRVSGYTAVDDQNKYVSAKPSSGASQTSDDLDTKRVEMVVPKDISEFASYMQLRTRVGQTPLTLDDTGAIISEKLAEELGVSVGDKVLLFDQSTTGDAEGTGREVTVAGITEDYTTEHVYLTPACYKQVTGQEPSFDTYLCKTSGGQQERTDLEDDLSQTEGVSTVSDSSSTIDYYRSSLSSVRAVVALLIVAAALLAFVVIYNLTNINIEERIREIATLKVLGFNSREENAYIFREVIILSVVGALVGLLLGAWMEQYVVLAAESSQVMFGRDIHATSFLFSFLLTLVFTVVIMLFMRGKLAKVSMVDSLKSVD